MVESAIANTGARLCGSRTPKFGGNIVLTVNEGSVRKYLETSLRIADEYNVRHYMKQRLQLLEIEMKSLFESDKMKQKGLADFM